MRFVIFKIIIFFTVFLIVQGFIMPWCISNHTLPVWADLFLIGLTLFAWVVVIDVICKMITKKMDEEEKQD